VSFDKQLMLFDAIDPAQEAKHSSTFVNNMKLPVHRWFRYSAGFSAQWAESVIVEAKETGPTRVVDPFAGSATALIAAEDVGMEAAGVESHPFVCRVARAKLARRTDPAEYRGFAQHVLENAGRQSASIEDYPKLIHKCYRDSALQDLDKLRRAFEGHADGSSASELTWLTLVSILRKTSHVGTANWQYVLPKKSKKQVLAPFDAFEEQIAVFYRDMLHSQDAVAPRAMFIEGDARKCEGIATDWANLVVTSPPYPNNYDYADATRLEMCFLKEIGGWGDLQKTVREHLVVSCSQHVPEKSVDLSDVMNADQLAPIAAEIKAICEELAAVRLTKGGRKTYHLMVACYFLDLAQVWHALRRVCRSPCRVCFVVGDSAPYGVYVPVFEWLGKLALAAGFHEFRFEKIRDRNVKWKNRKHRVPLSEGRLWVTG